MMKGMSIKTLSSRIAYQNHWMRVREDQIERSNGSLSIYGVVEKPDFAVIIPRDGDDFILIEQYRYTVKSRYPEFPQGAWEDNPGAHPEDLARGELREETGYTAKRMEYLGKYQSAYGFSQQAFHIFLAMDLEPGECSPDAEEHDLLVRRVPIAQFESMILRREIVDSHTMAAYLLYKLHGK
jgi:8-oxo-dGTP pyrophosphatase MutT (NUDIX family)